MTAVAVVGLGAMGRRMARRLLVAGHDVIVWNRTSEKMSELTELGAMPAESPADAAHRADAVITMVSDPEALRARLRRRRVDPDDFTANIQQRTTRISWVYSYISFNCIGH